jgi:uncharacterized membrane protein YcaP (DUF421 family)
MENVIEGTPTLLIHNGRIIHQHLQKELLSTHELRTILRRQGIHDLNEIAEAILESNGSISVTKKSEIADNHAHYRYDPL